MSSGAWIFNYIEQHWQWYENGKAYPSPDQIPEPNQKRPYLDRGKPVSRSDHANNKDKEGKNARE